ncbi:MAG: prepilin-type N-terminal cleavage/methylation domain-containing protein [Candidatus Parcubacteria bacterium]|nr:prepilin-type N-terminal cleavage/methylation domain-containing protein [Candidatus Parcubacteria bacterium]
MNNKGITILELLIVMAIIAAMASFSVPATLDFYRSQQMQSDTKGILQALRETQSKAMSVESDSGFGIYFETARYISFKGDSYAGRDIAFDQIFNLAPTDALSGLKEIVFSKSEGLPNEISPAFCSGICTPCDQFGSKNPCQAQAGCNWSGGICRGTCQSCSSFLSPPTCSIQSVCLWQEALLGGNISIAGNGATKTININEAGLINLQ